MTGGLMQLVAYGAQDIYLTGNPMITYFKVVYRRHTNFAMESIEQTFNGTVGFGNRVTALISRNGDLVSGLTLQITLPKMADDNGVTAWTNDIGHHLIEECSVEIGGQQIDKHYGDWLEIWAQLTVPASKMAGYREMIGQDFDPASGAGMKGGLQQGSDTSVPNGSRLDADGERVLYVPLQFWFCRNIGLALPLIALQYHEVKVNVTFLQQSSCYITTGTNPPTFTPSGSTGLRASLWADYIYLDTDERRRFAQVSHEYLIEQLQFSGNKPVTAGNTPHTFDINFNHPVKELVWVIRRAGAATGKQWSNYTTQLAAALVNNTGSELHARPGTEDMFARNPVLTAKLKLNGHDRFADRPGDYFNLEQTLKHHTNVPVSPGINVYSFALKPEDHQPSGTCNFSRIDNAQLHITTGKFNDATDTAAADSGVCKIFAVNYNVLRIMSGMGGLAYSN
jgi:hypothetical protein